MTEYKHLTVTKEEHVALVTMCSTPVNTLTDGFMDELEHVFLALKEDAEIWAVVLCSSLKCFVSGADIKNLAICDRYGNITLAERMQRVFLAVEDFPHPRHRRGGRHCLRRRTGTGAVLRSARI